MPQKFGVIGFGGGAGTAEVPPPVAAGMAPARPLVPVAVPCSLNSITPAISTAPAAAAPAMAGTVGRRRRAASSSGDSRRSRPERRPLLVTAPTRSSRPVLDPPRRACLVYSVLD